jgi:pyruvate/2-oxoglutarate dehydrogenase complex dihydrolipoamide acyltransferase (E2) component
MRALSALLIGGLLSSASACAATVAPAQTPKAAPTTATAPTTTTATAQPRVDDKWKSRPANAECQRALAALAGVRLDEFHGLGSCGRVDAEAALGSSGDAPSRFEQLGEYRPYRTPGGTILVWFLSDDIRVMQLLYPRLPRPLRALVGEPEAKVRSELSSEWEQWIYASRGMTAHVRRGTNDVVALYAYRPSTVEAFLKTDIARVAKSEAPLEELR